MRESSTTAAPDVGLGGLDGRAQHPLAVPLHVAVDGQPEVLAVDRLDLAVVAERDPVAAADLVGLLAVLAGQQLVEAPLEPARDLGGRRPGSRSGWPRRRRPGRCAAGRGGCRRRRSRASSARPSRSRRASRGSAGRRRRTGSCRSSWSACRAGRSSRGAAGRRGSSRSPRRWAWSGSGRRRPSSRRPTRRAATPLRSRMRPALGRQRDVDQPGRLGARGVGLGVDALELEEPGAEEREQHRDRQQADPQADMGRPTQTAALPGSGAALGTCQCVAPDWDADVVGAVLPTASRAPESWRRRGCRPANPSRSSRGPRRRRGRTLITTVLRFSEARRRRSAAG